MSLLLTEDDVRKVLPMADLITAMEEALAAYSAGRAVQPVRSVLEIGDHAGFFGLMPAAMADPASFGAKLVTVFHKNLERGLPSHLATIVLFDPDTGALSALVDGRFITEARTAAVSAVSAKHLARADARTLAVIGSGVQAGSHIRAMQLVRPIDQVRVWSPNEARRSAFAETMSAETGLRIDAVATPRHALDGADIIVLATASSTPSVPVISDDMVANGAHLCTVGASRPDQREMPTALVARTRVFVDSRAGAMKEAGDLLIPMAEGAFDASQHIAGELGELVLGRVVGRADASQITAFKSLGMAVEDVVAASLAVAPRARTRHRHGILPPMTRTAIVIAILVAAATMSAAPNSRLGRADDTATLIHDAFDAAYNLNYDQALVLAKRAVQVDPNSAAAHRVVADVIWLKLIFLRGAVSVDYYAGTTTKSQAMLPKTPPDLAAEFTSELNASIAICEAELKKNKKDAAAEFDLGAAYGLQASYMASVEGKLSGALGPARHAYEAHDTVLELAPTKVEANLIVGTYRYLESTFALPVLLMAYIVGFGGGKERGISMIELAAAHGDAQTDADFALILIYNAEKRFADALRVIRLLEPRFPNNRILVLEEGATALRAGQARDADRILTAGLDRLAQDSRPRFAGERALWLYKRGAARVVLGQKTGAIADLNDATAAQPIGWVLGRIRLEFGKLADLDGARDRATATYREAASICRANNDTLCVDAAERLERRPFTLQ